LECSVVWGFSGLCGCICTFTSVSASMGGQTPTRLSDANKR
jgi:hypothetical protein